jgi:hypothetical protein
MKIKTSELIGPALDSAVAKCAAVKLHPIPQNGVMEVHFSQPNGGDSFSPSSDWAIGGPIIEQEGIELALITYYWEAGIAFSGKEVQHGPTPLVAAMRCYVASKLGDEVEIPEELK